MSPIAASPIPVSGPSLAPLLSLVAADMQQVNAVIIANVQNDVRLIADLATYIVSAGGKRLRPALTLACAQLCGYQGMRHIQLAACVEFIHTATLLHDDVVDASDLRRGQPTANAVWSNQSSVLVGDFLFSRAFQLMVSDGSLPVLKLLSDTSATIAEGEVKQLTVTHAPQTDAATYLGVVEAKTAALFAAAAQIGAMVSATPEREETLNRFGRNLGIAFQLVDDALDYAANEQTLGKSIGDDFREGKITLPVILAYQQGNKEEKAFFERTLGEGMIQDGDLEQATAIIRRYRTIEQTLAAARDYAETARQALLAFPASAMRDALEEAIDFSIERAF